MNSISALNAAEYSAITSATLKSRVSLTFIRVNITIQDCRGFSHTISSLLCYVESWCSRPANHLLKNLIWRPVYLQRLWYIIEYYLESRERSCYCRLRAATNLISTLHDALSHCGNLQWECVTEKILVPYARCALSVPQAKAKLERGFDLEKKDSSLTLIKKLHILDLGSDSAAKCGLYLKDVPDKPLLSGESRSLYERLQSLTSAAVCDSDTVDCLNKVWGNWDNLIVTNFLLAVTAEIELTLNLDGVDPSISFSQFATLIKTATDHHPASKNPAG